MTRATQKTSMRHLYLYTYLLLDEVKRAGRPIRIEWSNMPTASIGPDPQNDKGLVMKLSNMAATGTEEDAILLRALVAHEILCHGNNTDFGVKLPPGLAGRLTNPLEDARGELLASKSYGGSKKVIREGIEILTQRGIFKGPDADASTLHPAEILFGWLVTELRSELLGQKCLEGFSVAYRKLAIQTFGTKLTAQVKAEALKAAHAADTQGAANASQRIVELLELAAKEPPPPPPQDGTGQGDGDDQANASDQDQPGNQGDQDQGDQDQTGDQGDPDEQNGQDDQGDGGDQDGPGDQGNAGNSGDQDAGDGSTGNMSADDTSGATGQNGGNPGSGSAVYEPSYDDLQQAIADVLDSTDADAGNYGKGLEDVLCEGNEAMQQASGGSHTNEMREVDAPNNVRPPEHRAQLRSAARSTAATLALKMEELLEAHSMVQRSSSTEGRLRPNKVARVATGDLRVFQKKSRSEELDTCLYFLNDESASMGETFGNITRREAAGRVAVAAGEVCDNASIPFGLASYSTSVREWQPMDGDWAKTLNLFTAAARDCTNTHLAVVWALKRLMDRKESRKILCVTTDGDPGDLNVLEAAIQEAKRFGVEVRFVLIDKEYEHYYRGLSAAFGVATNPHQLAEAVFGSLEAAFS
ncbi:VWA domain-containing protein [Noviherbaspirillum suwonense]|uniref:von Willebrand factor type A domain-containing protein n=1 Tax=Noviherbaspirillum suwonense TaxID=1224511 RepID=A0ABY1QN09_9BURK|nr:VWA domain-containing protein [Noviherbaspirillum suwonense]SMP72631.1 von Willebrand factor type A domain-containing protein [Noviherbaspirillum suwonense]